jgi:hypothetical protein
MSGGTAPFEDGKRGLMRRGERVPNKAKRIERILLHFESIFGGVGSGIHCYLTDEAAA